MSSIESANLRKALLLKKLYLLQSLGYDYCDPLLHNPKSNPLAPTDIRGLQTMIQNCNLCSSKTSKPHEDILHPNSKIAFMSFFPLTDSKGDLISNSGDMLKKIIKNVFELEFYEISVISLLKCSIPHSMQSVSIEKCNELVKAQLQLITPKIILALGEVAYQTLSGDKTKFSTLQGKCVKWGGFQLIPTYDLLELLRNPALKRKAHTEFLAIKDNYL